MSTFERNVKGLLGTKLGMTQTWDENNRIVPVTVVSAQTNVVTQVRTPASDGYNAIPLAYGEGDGAAPPRQPDPPRSGWRTARWTAARSPSPRRVTSPRPV